MRGQRGSKPPKRAAALQPRGAGRALSAWGQPSARPVPRGTEPRGSSGPGAEGSLSSPHLPRSPLALFRTALAPTDAAEQRVGVAWGGRWVAAPRPSAPVLPLRQLCPVSVRTPSLLSNFGYSEALGTDVADTRESESTLGSGCSLTATVKPGPPASSAVVRAATGVHAGLPGGARRSPSPRGQPYLS